MLAALAFCPAPPLLVPELAAGAAAELDVLRAACARAVRTLLATAPEEIVVLAPGRPGGRFPAGSPGTLAGYGVPVTAELPTGEAAAQPGGRLRRHRHYLPALPPALTLGAWLLAGADRPCSGLAVGPDDDPAELAAGLPGGRIALLVLGDGSARRSEQAPGYVDPRAAGFDAAVAAALAAGDPAALLALDPALGADLLAAGVPAWHTAARAATPAPAGGWAAELAYDDAPYGVGYVVATWLPR